MTTPINLHKHLVGISVPNLKTFNFVHSTIQNLLLQYSICEKCL